MIPRFKRGIWNPSQRYSYQEEHYTLSVEAIPSKMSLYYQSKDIPNEILDGIFSEKDLLDSQQSAKDEYTSKGKKEAIKDNSSSESWNPNNQARCSYCCENLEAVKN